MRTLTTSLAGEHASAPDRWPMTAPRATVAPPHEDKGTQIVDN
jgi:hypothetical protein